MKAFKKRPKAVFQISKLRRYGDFKDKVVSISGKIAGNTTLFPTPSPTVVAVNGHIADMEAEQAKVGLRIAGSVAARDNAVQIVVEDVGRKWLAYVQELADAQDYEAALIIITSAGFDVKVNNKFVKPELRIVLTDNPSVIKLIARSKGKNVAYEWQQSINNSILWTNLPASNVANTLVSGLTSKASYLFRFRFTVKNVPSGWSMPVSIVIQ